MHVAPVYLISLRYPRKFKEKKHISKGDNSNTCLQAQFKAKLDYISKTLSQIIMTTHNNTSDLELFRGSKRSKEQRSP